MTPLVQVALQDRVMKCLADAAEMSWKQLYEATGKPTMSSLSRAVRVLEAAGKVERERVTFERKLRGHEDLTHAARVMIRRKA